MSSTDEATTTPDTAAEPAALPGDSIRERLVEELREHLGEALLDSYVKTGLDVWVRVRTDAWRQAAEVLRDRLGYTYFCYLSAIDWMPSPFGKGEEDPTDPAPERDDTVRQGYTGGDTRFQMLARVVHPTLHVGVHLKCDVPGDDPNDPSFSVDSWFQVYAGANWHERETHEMFGIGFAGHPNLINMYLPTEFEGYPLRKDFPLLARMVKPWPGIVDVEPMPVEEEDQDGVVGDTGDAPEGDAPEGDVLEGDAT